MDKRRSLDFLFDRKKNILLLMLFQYYLSVINSNSSTPFSTLTEKLCQIGPKNIPVTSQTNSIRYLYIQYLNQLASCAHPYKFYNFNIGYIIYYILRFY
jgi:hypothetical protein